MNSALLGFAVRRVNKIKTIQTKTIIRSEGGDEPWALSFAALSWPG